ncbi:hypothetical protein [Acinetobacter pseudolwoffii]|uniref:hypothetical protein n=1 Tax=Acinetobacter pseudolwoffii TaxID=2053287 RepID=UPI00148DA03A|nr:hypothetical protein [Acinetobacter pseudolwoffii]
MLINTNTAQKASFNQFSNNATENKPKPNEQEQKPNQGEPAPITKEQNDQKDQADKKNS